MSDAPGDSAAETLELSDDEKRVLALYDQLKSIRLEIALLKARESFTGGKLLDQERGWPKTLKRDKG